MSEAMNYELEESVVEVVQRASEERERIREEAVMEDPRAAEARRQAEEEKKQKEAEKLAAQYIREQKRKAVIGTALRLTGCVLTIAVLLAQILEVPGANYVACAAIMGFVAAGSVNLDRCIRRW